MTRLIAGMMSFLVLTGLLGCGQTQADKGKDAAPDAPVKWFDSFHEDDMIWDGVREIARDEFPGVTFRWQYAKLEAVTEKETVTLYGGMPIWSVYFCDLTGDGKPELCSTISIGSGLVDNRIFVYDYAKGESFELADRAHYDYVLTLRNNRLCAEKRRYADERLLAAGEIILRDGVLQMLPDEENELDYTARVAWANWTEDGRIYAGALNGKLMIQSAIRHLPLYRLDTLSELERFRADFGDILTMDRGYGDVPSFDDATSDFDDAFFAEHSLMLAYMTAGSGSFRFAVDDVFCDGTDFCMYVTQTNHPEVYTADMAGWFVMAAVPDEAIESCTGFDAQLR